jgi:chromosome segregation ATPase
MLYYNGDTIIKDNKKYIIPSLETEDGRKWNNSSLIGICNLWMNVKKKKTTIENKIKEINNKINKLNQGLSAVEPEIKKLKKELEEKNKIYMEKQKEYKKLEIKFKLLQNSKKNSNEYFTMLKKLDKANSELMVYKDAVKEIQNKIDIIKESNMSSYIELAHYKDLKKNLLLDLKAQTLNINSKSQQMDPILNSLAKALMSRKKLIS